MMRSVLLAIDSIPSSYLGQPIVHLHFVTKFKSWTLGFSLRVPNRRCVCVRLSHDAKPDTADAVYDLHTSYVVGV